LSIGQVAAFDPLSSKELASHYQQDPEGKEGIFCARDIQGFIDGAVATDERVALNVAAEYAKEETFAQRAIRTRMGSRMQVFGSSYCAGFRLGAPVPLADVVKQVVDDLGDVAVNTELGTARELVYHSLRTHYPCEPKS
jgi:hypothetical protein